MQVKFEHAKAISVDPLPFKAGEWQGNAPEAAAGSQTQEVVSMTLSDSFRFAAVVLLSLKSYVNLGISLSGVPVEQQISEFLILLLTECFASV